MASIEINARKREAQGTGASRRLRRLGKVPGILYGGDKDPINIELDHQDLFLNLRNERFRTDGRPLVEGMANYTCRNFSRAYLRHLFLAGEMLGGTLFTIHNLHFFLELMTQARVHIEEGDFGPWHRSWIERYESSQTASA